MGQMVKSVEVLHAEPSKLYMDLSSSLQEVSSFSTESYLAPKNIQ